MAIVIRVAYNNQNWEEPCKTPGKDGLCWLCFEDILEIIPPKRTDEVCSGHCWEQHLCIEYRWGCTPKGRIYGNRARPGIKVFFVFKQPDGNYTLWGKTTVHSVDDEIVEEGRDDEVGFAFIHFNPFEPLTRDKWVRNLSDVQLVGAKWLQGRHRYISTQSEAYLEQLIEGIVPEKQEEAVAIAPSDNSDNNVNLSISVTPNIYKKLESIANEEGRQVDEIMREAIAEWMKGRLD